MQLMLMLGRRPAPRAATRLRLFDRLPSLTHPELVLAAVEDERDDQILLVGEVADEAGQELVGDEAVAVGTSAHRVGLRRLEERVRRVGETGDPLVEDVVIVLQHLEATHETRLGGAKEREIAQILDLMMHLELRQEELQARREPPPELRERQGALPELRRRGFKRAPEITEHVVAIEP